MKNQNAKTGVINNNNRLNFPVIIAAIILFNFISFPLFAQSIDVSVDTKELSLNDTITMTIKMGGDFDNFVEPKSDNFEVVGRQQSSSITIINNSMKQEKILTLTLAPLTTGELKIGEAQLLKAGKIVARSNPIPIKVSGQGRRRPGHSPPQMGLPHKFSPFQQPRVEEEESDETVPAPLPAESLKDLQPMAGKPFFIRVKFPDRKIYIGEPFVLSFDLFIRQNVMVRGARLVKGPKFEGFIREDLSSQSQKTKPQRRSLGKYIYEVHPQMKYLLTAVKPENILMDSLVIDIYSGGFFDERNNRVSSPPFTLNIASIPEENRPSGYREGQIGIFIVNASLSKPNILLSEKGVLTVEVSGSGNLMGIRQIQLKPVKGLIYDPIPSKDMDEINKDEGGISGKRVFQFLITPKSQAEYVLPPVELTFFNPLLAKFETARSQELRLLVTGEKAVPVMNENRSRENEIASIIWDSDLGVTSSNMPDNDQFNKIINISGKPFLLMMVLPLFLLIAAEAVFRYRKYKISNAEIFETRNACKVALQRIKELSKQKSLDVAVFYEEIEKIIEDFLVAKLKVPVKGITVSKLRELLLKAEAREEDAINTTNELENCSFLRFAPSKFQTDELEDTLVRIKKILLNLEKSKLKVLI